jgi:hypothetical protein
MHYALTKTSMPFTTSHHRTTSASEKLISTEQRVLIPLTQVLA